MADTPTLAVSRYVEIGTYIGQYFIAGAGTLPNEVRVPCLVGKGERYVIIKNQPLRRSFVYDEPITFSTISPFVANLSFPADGNQSSPVLLRTADGNEITADKWSFALINSEYSQIQLTDKAYNPTTTYYFSYQSVSRSVKDPIPTITIQQLQATAEVREITAISVVQDHDEYLEYTDFYMDFELDAPAIVSVTNASSQFSAINQVTDVASTGSVGFATGVSYLHKYTRNYVLTCTAVTGTTSATFKWTSTPTIGNGMQPPIPLNVAEPAPTFTVTDGEQVILDENGAIVIFHFGATNFVATDSFSFTGQGASLLELDPRNLNTNQFTEFSTINCNNSSTGTLVDFATSPQDYQLLTQCLNFQFRVFSISGLSGGPGRQATISWSGFGTTLISGVFTLDESTSTSLIQPLGCGISLTFSFGAEHFAVGDTFSFNVKAPRLFYKGKESVRNTVFTVGSVGTSVVTGGYLTDTPEGRFGQWRTDNKFRFEIPDGLVLFVRNVLSQMVGDKFTMQARTRSSLDFSLMTEVTQQISNPQEVATDVTGVITGTVGAKYVTLSHLPISILSVKNLVHETVPYAQMPGTSYLILEEGFDSTVGDLLVNFRWSGAEPNPSQIYYLTASYLRPVEFYNKPILFLSKKDALAFLAPSTIRNDLYIGANICWDYNIQGLFAIQVYDVNGDGVYSREDYKNAIDTFQQDRRTTDLVVLNNFQSLPDQLTALNTANDPFSLHESLGWIGVPNGTPIGSEVEIGSLVSLSRRTLAVYGQSPAHGSRILHGSTRATKTITLQDGTTSLVTLDGSFISAALAAYNDSLTSPTSTILLGEITSFDFIQTYTPQENAILGGNNIIFFEDAGNGIYVITEDITTDPFAPDTSNINQMTQKQYVTKDIRTTVNKAIIGAVYPNASSGVITLQTVIASRLVTLITSGVIGDYQDANGNVRTINPATDTFVFRDKTDPTLFHIGYNYFLATTAKRVFGLFTVNLPGGFPR